MKKENNPATRLSIVIPVYNGEKTITGLCEKLIASLSDFTSLEIVLINDASEEVIFPSLFASPYTICAAFKVKQRPVNIAKDVIKVNIASIFLFFINTSKIIIYIRHYKV